MESRTSTLKWQWKGQWLFSPHILEFETKHSSMRKEMIPNQAANPINLKSSTWKCKNDCSSFGPQQGLSRDKLTPQITFRRVLELHPSFYSIYTKVSAYWEHSGETECMSMWLGEKREWEEQRAEEKARNWRDLGNHLGTSPCFINKKMEAQGSRWVGVCMCVKRKVIDQGETKSGHWRSFVQLGQKTTLRQVI